MVDELTKTWDDMAANWDKWGAPLRPSPEDLLIVTNAVKQWHKEFDLKTVTNVLLLGVTPEIAQITFPFSNTLIAVDKSQGMIDHVWPGDKGLKKKAVLGDWFNMPVPPKSQNIVLGDGVFVFFNPSDMDKLAASIAGVMATDSTFIIRQFIAPSKGNSPGQVYRMLNEGEITNFHTLKFRTAMANQPSFAEGVAQKDIWNVLNRTETLLDFNKKMVDMDKSTLGFYKDKEAKMYFPTLDEFQVILENYFQIVEVKTPTYDFGTCCPTFVLRLKKP